MFVYEFVVDLNESETSKFFPPGAWAIACTNMTCHGEDVAFTFDFVGKTDTGNNSFTRLSLGMMEYWSNFAASSNPNTGRSQPAVQWPTFSATNDAYMVLDFDGIHTTTDLDTSACDFFDKIGYDGEGILAWRG